MCAAGSTRPFPTLPRRRLWRGLAQQPLGNGYALGFCLLVKLAARRTRKPRVNAPNAAVAPEEERRRKRAEIHALRQFVCKLLRFTRQEHGVLDPVLLDERAKPDGI